MILKRVTLTMIWNLTSDNRETPELGTDESTTRMCTDTQPWMSTTDMAQDDSHSPGMSAP